MFDKNDRLEKFLTIMCLLSYEIEIYYFLRLLTFIPIMFKLYIYEYRMKIIVLNESNMIFNFFHFFMFIDIQDRAITLFQRFTTFVIKIFSYL